MAVRMPPGDERAWSYLGYAYAKKGEVVEAAAAFRRAKQDALAAELEHAATVRRPATPSFHFGHVAQLQQRVDTGVRDCRGRLAPAARSGRAVARSEASGTAFQPSRPPPGGPADQTREGRAFLRATIRATRPRCGYPGTDCRSRRCAPSAAAPSGPARGGREGRCAFPAKPSRPARVAAGFVLSRLGQSPSIPAGRAASGDRRRGSRAGRRHPGRLGHAQVGAGCPAGPGAGRHRADGHEGGAPFSAHRGGARSGLLAPPSGGCRLRLADDVLYVREDRRLAFEGPGVTWEAGAVPNAGLACLQFRGRGTVALELPTDAIAIKVTDDKPDPPCRRPAFTAGWAGWCPTARGCRGRPPFQLGCQGEGVVLARGDSPAIDPPAPDCLRIAHGKYPPARAHQRPQPGDHGSGGPDPVRAARSSTTSARCGASSPACSIWSARPGTGSTAIWPASAAR